MRKTFTLLFLLCATIIYLPNLSLASSSFESSDARYGYGETDFVKFYPNPMITDATIKLSDDIDLEHSKVSIVIYNIIGSEIYKIAQIKNYEEKISRDIFKSTGIYFYQLKIDDKVITTGRITVK